MTKVSPVTWSYIRYRLTDPLSGADNWQANAFGLLVAERFYPDLVACCRDSRSDAYGFFRHHLNRVWSLLQNPAARQPGFVSERDLQAITDRIPDNRTEDASGARAIAAGTICLHLCRFIQSGDRDDIARLALAAYSGVFVDKPDDRNTGGVAWAASIPFDEVGRYEATVTAAPGVQSELGLQNSDLAFVESLRGPPEQKCRAVLNRAFAGETIPTHWDMPCGG